MVSGYRQRLLESFLGCLSETTAHGLVRLRDSGSDGRRRPLQVKTVWLLAILASLAYCSVKVYESYKTFTSGDVATVIKANSVPFVFPDVYLCHESAISGSYSVALSHRDSEELNRYRRLVNATVAGFSDAETRLYNYAIRLINSLPYQFVSNRLGHQLQSVLYYDVVGVQTYTVNTTHLSIFHDPGWFNCILLSLPDKVRRSMQDSNTMISLMLYSDPPIPDPLDNSTYQDMHPYIDGGYINLKPCDLDAFYGLDATRSSGYRVFLTDQGSYPTTFDTQLIVGTGQKHQIVVKMQDIGYDVKDFAGKCVSGDTNEVIGVLNPYTGDMDSYPYNRAMCWYKEAARLSRLWYNCSVWRYPTMWLDRDLPSCFNMSSIDDPGFSNVLFDAERNQLLSKAWLACKNVIPCSSRVYTYQYSSSFWPSQRTWQNFRRTYSAYRADLPAGAVRHPGIDYLLNNATDEFARESLLVLTFSAAEGTSQSLQLSLAYDFNSLIADIGGLMGLFLGMSLLSLLELLELLHDLICCLFCSTTDSHVEEIQIVETSVAGAASESSSSRNT